MNTEPVVRTTLLIGFYFPSYRLRLPHPSGETCEAIRNDPAKCRYHDMIGRFHLEAEPELAHRRLEPLHQAVRCQPGLHAGRIADCADAVGRAVHVPVKEQRVADATDGAGCGDPLAVDRYG